VFLILKDSYGSGQFECIPSNETSELRITRQRCFNDYDSAQDYFDELTSWEYLKHRTPKVVSGVQEAA